MTNTYDPKMKIRQFIKESNHIELVYGDQAITDSLDAWGYLKALKSTPEVLLNDILKVHALIMQNLRPDIAGKIRDVDVQVGGRVCPPYEEVNMRLVRLLKTFPGTALEALKWHLAFENIHPFEDGNGRTGRLLYAHQCEALGQQWLMFRDKDKWGYYALFQEI